MCVYYIFENVVSDRGQKVLEGVGDGEKIFK